MNSKYRSHLVAGCLVLFGVVAMGAPASADTMISIADTEFIIPVFAGEVLGNGVEGLMNFYSEGRPAGAPAAEGFANSTPGDGDGAGLSSNPFNPLTDSQTFTMPAGSTYRGEITLNLYFYSPALLLPIDAATLRFTVYDLDFVTDDVAMDGTIFLQEMAVIDTVNGEAVSIDLSGFTGGVGTDDASVDLEIGLDPTYLTGENPSIFSLTLGAELTNNRTSSVTLKNTKEALLSNLSLTVTNVPEPSTLLLLGTGMAGLAAYRRRKAQC